MPPFRIKRCEMMTVHRTFTLLRFGTIPNSLVAELRRSERISSTAINRSLPLGVANKSCEAVETMCHFGERCQQKKAEDSAKMQS